MRSLGESEGAMISDEERREAARELRELDVSDIGDDGNIVDTPEESGALFSRILEVANDYRPGLHYAMSHFRARDAVELFAELIDRPTCRNKEDSYDRTFLCSACGYEAYTYGDSNCNPHDFSYCPECGAEVVE